MHYFISPQAASLSSSSQGRMTRGRVASLFILQLLPSRSHWNGSELSRTKDRTLLSFECTTSAICQRQRVIVIELVSVCSIRGRTQRRLQKSYIIVGKFKQFCPLEFTGVIFLILRLESLEKPGLEYHYHNFYIVYCQVLYCIALFTEKTS